MRTKNFFSIAVVFSDPRLSPHFIFLPRIPRDISIWHDTDPSALLYPQFLFSDPHLHLPAHPGSSSPFILPSVIDRSHRRPDSEPCLLRSSQACSNAAFASGTTRDWIICPDMCAHVSTFWLSSSSPGSVLCPILTDQRYAIQAPQMSCLLQEFHKNRPSEETCSRT